jgi:hypothetical protein
MLTRLPVDGNSRDDVDDNSPAQHKIPEVNYVHTSVIMAVHVEVKYTFLVMPSHCRVANPDAFSAGLLDLGLLLNNINTLGDRCHRGPRRHA